MTQSGVGQREAMTPHPSPCKHKTEKQVGSADLMEAGGAVRGRAGGGATSCDGRGMSFSQVECIAQQCQCNDHTSHAVQH